MKRVNWKRWLVVGLSCSLFMDSVVGVTVLAETITGATEQGVATSQSSDEASQTTQTTEESQATVASEGKQYRHRKRQELLLERLVILLWKGARFPFSLWRKTGRCLIPTELRWRSIFPRFRFMKRNYNEPP